MTKHMGQMSMFEMAAGHVQIEFHFDYIWIQGLRLCTWSKTRSLLFGVNHPGLWWAHCASCSVRRLKTLFKGRKRFPGSRSREELQCRGRLTRSAGWHNAWRCIVGNALWFFYSFSVSKTCLPSTWMVALEKKEDGTSGIESEYLVAFEGRNSHCIVTFIFLAFSRHFYSERLT